MTGISKETFHSGFNDFDIVGVDCLASPNVTTKYCPGIVSAIVDLVGEPITPWSRVCLPDRLCHHDLSPQGFDPN